MTPGMFATPMRSRRRSASHVGRATLFATERLSMAASPLSPFRLESEAFSAMRSTPAVVTPSSPLRVASVALFMMDSTRVAPVMPLIPCRLVSEALLATPRISDAASDLDGPVDDADPAQDFEIVIAVSHELVQVVLEGRGPRLEHPQRVAFGVCAVTCVSWGRHRCVQARSSAIVRPCSSSIEPWLPRPIATRVTVALRRAGARATWVAGVRSADREQRLVARFANAAARAECQGVPTDVQEAACGSPSRVKNKVSGIAREPADARAGFPQTTPHGAVKATAQDHGALEALSSQDGPEFAAGFRRAFSRTRRRAGR